MPRRRKLRNSWGSNEPAGPGKRRLRYWADLHDGRGYARHSKTIVGSRRDGDDELARLRVSHSSDVPTPTVGQLWERHEHPQLVELTEQGRLSPRTLMAYERDWKASVGPRWQDVPCTDVRPIEIQDWLLSMTRSAGNISKALLKLVLDQAVMLDVIPSNPASRKYRLGEDTTREKFAYTPSQLAVALEAVKETVAEVPFILSAYAGLRVGEACAVRREDVDFREDGTAVVRVRVQLTPRGEMTDRLKTRGSYRTVGIPSPIGDRLREIYEAGDGLPYLNDDGTGSPVKRRTVASWWKRAIDKTDIPYQPMQVLRPSFQTNLHWAGVPIEMTSRILGHASTSTTIESYDRPGDDALVNVMVEAVKNGPFGTNWDN